MTKTALLGCGPEEATTPGRSRKRSSLRKGMTYEMGPTIGNQKKKMLGATFASCMKRVNKNKYGHQNKEKKNTSGTRVFTTEKKKFQQHQEKVTSAKQKEATSSQITLSARMPRLKGV